MKKEAGKTINNQRFSMEKNQQHINDYKLKAASLEGQIQLLLKTKTSIFI